MACKKLSPIYTMVSNVPTHSVCARISTFCAAQLAATAFTELSPDHTIARNAFSTACQRSSNKMFCAAQLAATAFKKLSPVYTVVFVIVRTLIGPPAITWLARQLVHSTALPASLRCGNKF